MVNLYFALAGNRAYARWEAKELRLGCFSSTCVLQDHVPHGPFPHSGVHMDTTGFSFLPGVTGKNIRGKN